MQLVPAPAELGLSRLKKIKESLDRIFGENVWHDYELETISIELGLVFDELLRDKISLLRVLLSNPKAVWKDVLLFIYATEAINNTPVDFETVPHLTSLEICFAVHELQDLLKTPTQEEEVELGKGVVELIRWVLTEEGYTEVPIPLSSLVSFSLPTSEEVKPEDAVRKQTAIKAYIYAHEKGDIHA